MPMTRVLGIDAAGKAGWVGVVADSGGFVNAHVCSLADLIAWAEPVAAIGIDIPIGLRASGPRAADLAARSFVGPRRSSVFAAPPAEALAHSSYHDANTALEARGEPKMSRQTWALLPKIIEAQSCTGDGRIIEVHPEVSFRALAGEPVQWSKKTWNGQTTRCQLLANAGIVLPDELANAGGVPVDDLLDAAVAAWTARRYATGEAEEISDQVELDPSGRRIAIWY